MGGEDGPTDVAVGCHGCQFPPDVKENKKQTNKKSFSNHQQTINLILKCTSAKPKVISAKYE